MDLASRYVKDQSSQLSSLSHWVKCVPVERGQQETYVSFMSHAEGWSELSDVAVLCWSSGMGRNCTDPGFPWRSVSPFPGIDQYPCTYLNHDCPL